MQYHDFEIVLSKNPCNTKVKMDGKNVLTRKIKIEADSCGIPMITLTIPAKQVKVTGDALPFIETEDK